MDTDEHGSETCEADHVPPAIRRAVDLLEHCRTRPRMYFVPFDEVGIQNFLRGFTTGLTVMGLRWAGDVHEAALRKRGWQVSALGPVPQMQAAGMTLDQIFNELIDIQIDQLRTCTVDATPSSGS